MKKSGKRTHTRPFAIVDEIFSSILQMAHDAILVIEEEQKILIFNQGAEQLFGYNATELIGQQLDILLPPDVSEIHKIYTRDFAKSSITRAGWESGGKYQRCRKEQTLCGARWRMAAIPGLINTYPVPL